MRQFARLAQPGAEEVRIEWEGLEVEEIAPEELAWLVPGEAVSVIARVRSGEAGRAVLTASVKGERVRLGRRRSHTARKPRELGSLGSQPVERPPRGELSARRGGRRRPPLSAAPGRPPRAFPG